MPLISTRALTKRYPGVTALDGLTLDIGEGVIGLVGANGAGKSTLLKILLGLLDATEGDATVLDMDTATHGARIRELVGYMPEHDCLPPDVSATEFVSHMARVSGIPSGAARERTADILRHVGLFEERYRAIGTYSTGMKQRVKLAQALVHDPRLLMLDEPTNGLDPEGRDDMLDLIRRIGSTSGISNIMSSHLLGQIERVCAHLVVIDGGRLLRADTIASITESMQVLTVQVDRDEHLLEQRLLKHGLTVSRDGSALLVGLDGSAPYDIVRDEVVALGVGLMRMEQRHHTLEDLFRTD